MLESYGQTALLKELIYRWERNRELVEGKSASRLYRIAFSSRVRDGTFAEKVTHVYVRTRWSNSVYQQDLPRFTRVPCTLCIQLLDESDFYSYKRRMSLDEREK